MTASIRYAQTQIDVGRALPSSLTTALTEAGMFRMLLPTHLGEAPLSLPRSMRCIETIAQADNSTGWCTGQGGVFKNRADRMSEAAADDIWGADPNAFVAAGSQTGSTALKTDTGYRLNGRWMFASGVMHATWLAAMAPVVNPADTRLGLHVYVAKSGNSAPSWMECAWFTRHR